MTVNITHKQLVRAAGNWLRENECTVVIAELSTVHGGEIPDAIGFNGFGMSKLVECKTSRADFMADAKKSFRVIADMGMGIRRYMATPKGLLQPEELPCGWGLIEYDGRVFRKVVDSGYHDANRKKEVQILVAAMRRLQLSTCVYVVQDIEVENDR